MNVRDRVLRFHLDRRRYRHAFLNLLGQSLHRHQRRHIICALLFHQVERFLIKKRSVLDRIDARANRPFRSLRAMRMRCSFQTQSVRFVHQRVQLGLRQLRCVHRIRQRKHSAGRASFNDRRAIFVRQPHCASRFIRSVHYANFRSRLRSQRAFAVSRFVAVAARRSDGMHRHQHARPRHHATIDRVAQPGVQIISRANVAHRCKSSHQCNVRVDARIQSHFWNRLAQTIQRRFGIVLAIHHGQVRMRIDESRHQRCVAQVNCLCIRGSRCTRSNARNFSVRHNHNSGRDQRIAFPVEHPRGLQHIGLRRFVLLCKHRLQRQNAQCHQHHASANHSDSSRARPKF